MRCRSKDNAMETRCTICTFTALSKFLYMVTILAPSLSSFTAYKLAWLRKKCRNINFSVR